MEGTWFLAATWLALAPAATLVAIWLGISTAPSEIVVGTVAQLPDRRLRRSRIARRQGAVDHVSFRHRSISERVLHYAQCPVLVVR